MMENDWLLSAIGLAGIIAGMAAGVAACWAAGMSSAILDARLRAERRWRAGYLADKAIVDAINELRSSEGNTVTVNSANVDFYEHPDEAVDVVADWTGWKVRRFGGDTLTEALQAAVKAKRAADAVEGE